MAQVTISQLTAAASALDGMEVEVNDGGTSKKITVGQIRPASTDAVSEGSNNLYHTTARAAAAAPVQSIFGRTGDVTGSPSDVGLGDVPNEDATDPANWPFSIGPRDIPWKEDARGTVSASQTLDLSAANYFKAEPTANITFDFTNTSNGSSGLRGGLILLTGGGDHTISWTVGGAGTVSWVGGSAPTLATGTGRDLIAATPISSTEVLLSLVQGDF